MHLSVGVTHHISYTLLSRISYRIIGHIYIIQLNGSREQLLKLSSASSKHWNLICAVKQAESLVCPLYFFGFHILLPNLS